MRLATVSDRSVLITRADRLVDIATATAGAFSSDIADCYPLWDELTRAAADLESESGRPLTEVADEEWGNPAPRPRQVFAIGLNYAAHAAEAGVAVPDDLTVFTKFVSAFAPPNGTISLPPAPATVDWEVELVAVVGRAGAHIPAAQAWRHIAGVTVGQDISERTRQQRGPAPQYSLAKSFPGFAPIGPMLVTPDEFADPDDIEIGCRINGEQVQHGRTSDMVFPVPEIVARLSAVTPLFPGDVIFTGTPPGVGIGRTPQRFLMAGDELVTYATGVGTMRHRIVAV